MVGSEYSYSHLTPSRFSEKHEDGDGDDHAGTIDVNTMSAFALYGISNKLNLLLRIPYTIWRQKTADNDNHHRTETIGGLGDITIGLRILLKNSSFGPGQRLFAGFNITFPTGESYNLNPFSENADSIRHSHFAPGDGHFSTSINLEWWYRSEFPLVLGIQAIYEFPLNTSVAGFRSGQKTMLNLQAINQRPLFWRSFPYIKLKVRRELADRWQGKIAENSGGAFFDGTAALDFEISESLSSILSLDLPVWRSIKGSQMDGFIVGASIRKIFY